MIIINIIVISNSSIIINVSITYLMCRSKELRESLSRPSSRLSCENGMEKMGKDVVRMIMIITLMIMMIIMMGDVVVVVDMFMTMIIPVKIKMINVWHIYIYI